MNPVTGSASCRARMAFRYPPSASNGTFSVPTIAPTLIATAEGKASFTVTAHPLLDASAATDPVPQKASMKRPPVGRPARLTIPSAIRALLPMYRTLMFLPPSHPVSACLTGYRRGVTSTGSSQPVVPARPSEPRTPKGKFPAVPDQVLNVFVCQQCDYSRFANPFTGEQADAVLAAQCRQAGLPVAPVRPAAPVMGGVMRRGHVCRRPTKSGGWSRWYAVIDLEPEEDGKRRQITRSFDTRPEAHSWLAGQQRAVEVGPTVDEFLCDW